MKTVEFAAKSRPLVKLKDWGLKPLVLDFYMQRIWPTFSIERVFARVIGKMPLSPHAVTLTLKPNFNFKDFKPGQHLLLTTTVDGQRYTRTYSPTLKSPRRLEITVKNIADGKVSSQICQFLKPGAIVEVSQPFGNMTWSELPPSAHYTFCAGGVGITPLRSLLYAWDKTPSLRQNKSIDLHYWAHSAEELYFKEEILGFEKRNPRLKVHFYTTRSTSAGARINESLFANSETVFVACGPQSFVTKTEEIAIGKKQRFYGEHAQEAKVEEAAGEETFFDIIYDDQMIQASSKKTILESLEEKGFKPVHGCRMGICKSCTCMKASGLSLNIKNQTISHENNEEIQICVSKPRSQMTVRGY